MVAHINAEIPNDRWWRDQERIAILETQLKFWRERAENLVREIENIPDALHQHGEWYIRAANGEETHVILDPVYHAPKGET